VLLVCKPEHGSSWEGLHGPERARLLWLAARYRPQFGRVPIGEREDDVTGVVYIVGGYDANRLKYVKIGYTSGATPFRRVEAIRQNTPLEIRLLAATPGCRTLELAYFWEFKDFGVRGEWFRPGAPIMARVKELDASYGERLGAS
jgi:hypothetical protein